jgi:3-oxoisoapionate kinase
MMKRTPSPVVADAWQDGPLVAYAGDDFTGSTDAMEAFTAAGVPSVLFLRLPEPHWVKKFAGMRCIGLATTARSQSPEWMEKYLLAAFQRLKSFGAPLLHYKICSTFDSAPDTGSIGKAVELGTRVMGTSRMPADWSPMIVGAPRLKRYQAFGTLFAIAEGKGHRLDRHPTMSRHPVTPMLEADLARHLGQQTKRRIGLIDFTQIKAGEADAQRRFHAGSDTPIVLIDVLDEETLEEAGRLIWENRGDGVFSASSSGLQYALAAHWRKRGLLPQTPSLSVAEPVSCIAVFSGSCSPVTGAQIAWAGANGFALLRLDIDAALGAHSRRNEIVRVVGEAVKAIGMNQSPLVYSAAGPDDPHVTGFDQLARKHHMSRAEAAASLGELLGLIARELLDQSSALRRIVIAGGDSSGAVAAALDIAALSIKAGLSPGAPLCTVWSDNPARDGLEIVLKGGQMGGPEFFQEAKGKQKVAGA